MSSDPLHYSINRTGLTAESTEALSHFMSGIDARRELRNGALIRRAIEEFRSQPCMDCGVNYPTYVTDGDHRDPSTKAFSLSQSAGHTIEEVRAEIVKCDPVCRNCHAERTHKRVSPTAPSGQGIDSHEIVATGSTPNGATSSKEINEQCR